MHQEGSMKKGTLFLFGVLLVLIGAFEATSDNSISYLFRSDRGIDVRHRNIASFNQPKEEKVSLNQQLNGLMKLNPSQHVKVYHENFKLEKKASL